MVLFTRSPTLHWHICFVWNWPQPTVQNRTLNKPFSISWQWMNALFFFLLHFSIWRIISGWVLGHGYLMVRYAYRGARVSLYVGEPQTTIDIIQLSLWFNYWFFCYEVKSYYLSYLSFFLPSLENPSIGLNTEEILYPKSIQTIHLLVLHPSVHPSSWIMKSEIREVDF